MKRLNFGQHRVFIYNSADELKRAAAEHLGAVCTARAKQAEKVSIALSGGSTPVGVYQNLLKADLLVSATDKSSTAFPWQQILFFFGDERYVPHDAPDSNYRMAKEAFLNSAPISSDQVYPVPTDCEQADACAQRYAEQLSELDQHNNMPVFDYILLGIGDDGHTASLFPNTSIINEKNKPTAAVYVEKLQTWRISLTFPVLNQARVCSVLVSGENKAAVLADVIQNDKNICPVGRIENKNGINWFVDQAAASQLR